MPKCCSLRPHTQTKTPLCLQIFFKAPKLNQLSSKKRISLSFPTSHLKRSSKLPLEHFDFQISFKSFHHKETLFLYAPHSFKHLQPPYLNTMVSFHNPLLLDLKRHIHFPSKATLKVLILIMPKSPAYLDLQTLSHTTQAIFLPLDPKPHKTFICKLTIFFITLASILNKER